MGYFVYGKGKKYKCKTLNEARSKGIEIIYSNGGVYGNDESYIYDASHMYSSGLRYVGAVIRFRTVEDSRRNIYDTHIAWVTSKNTIHDLNERGDIWGRMDLDHKTERWVIDMVKELKKSYFKEYPREY